MANSAEDTRPFLKVFTGPLETLAMDQSIDAHYRVHLLALARAEPNRHAEFKPGALARLMGKNGKPHNDIGRVIQRAIARNLLDPSSMPECLVLPDGLAAPYDRTGRAHRLDCKTHGGTPTPLYTAECHPARKHKAHGLCDPCYRAEIRYAERDGREPWWVSPQSRC